MISSDAFIYKDTQSFSNKHRYMRIKVVRRNRLSDMLTSHHNHIHLSLSMKRLPPPAAPLLSISRILRKR